MKDTLRPGYTSIYEAGESKTRGYEDNEVVPVTAAHRFLEGRVLSGYSDQAFEPAWFFQRFVNRCMQVFAYNADKHAWYETVVEGGRIEYAMPIAGVSMATVFALLSPFLYPWVFGGAVLVLGPSIPYIRSFYKYEIDANADVRTLQPTEERRYSWESIMGTACMCCWYLLISTFPWIYYMRGPYSCVMDITCKEVSYHISPVTVWSLSACCVFSGFRFMRAITTSACDCACEIQMNKMCNHSKYGKALSDIIVKLSNMEDKLSFFPVFVFGESDEPDDLPLGMATELSLIVVAAIHALTPLLWMMYRHEQAFLPFESDLMSQILVFLGTAAPFLEVRSFFLHFHKAIEEFADVVDELVVLVYIASPRSGKARTLLKKKFQDAISRNDKWRRANSAKMKRHTLVSMTGSRLSMRGRSEKKKDTVKDCAFLEDAESRFDRSRTSNRSLAEEPECMDELEHLCEYQVAFNFRRLDGIILFQHMRKWLMTDILNERLEVELFMNMSLQGVFVGLLVLLLNYFYYHKVTCIWLLIPFDIVVLSAFMLRTLSLCVDANEYLFDETAILLLTWQEHCTNWKRPESQFECKNRKPAIAWTWDTDKNEPKAVSFDRDIEAGKDDMKRDIEDGKEIYKSLETMAKRLAMLEQKQKIVGLEVTKQLRTRVVASLGSVVAALALKVPELLQRDEFQKALHHVKAQIKD